MSFMLFMVKPYIYLPRSGIPFISSIPVNKCMDIPSYREAALREKK
jgi:hypothetical protein